MARQFRFFKVVVTVVLIIFMFLSFTILRSNLNVLKAIAQHEIFAEVPTLNNQFPGTRTSPVLHQVQDIQRTMTGEKGRSRIKVSKQYRYLEQIQEDCGELCDTSRAGVEGPFFHHMTANIQCEKLFRNEDIDRGHGQTQAPREIPAGLLNEFTMNGRARLIPMYRDRKYLGDKARTPLWSNDYIENQIDLARNGLLNGTYGIFQTNRLLDVLKHNSPNVRNGRILVIGSERPWVEACALEAGAREVVTLEYGAIVSEHPKIKTMVPSVFRQKYLNGTLGTFDGIITFSSVEHSGLGRYGDALNPWGDIITIARAWCVTREGGSLTIGLPYEGERDAVAFNAHRVYGKIRYPYLTTNWHQHYRQSIGWQRIFVFIK